MVRNEVEYCGYCGRKLPRNVQDYCGPNCESKAEQQIVLSDSSGAWLVSEENEDDGWWEIRL